MPVITINGPIGSGPAPVVGQMVADMLGLNFVDRLIFTTAARMMGAPVGALIEKEQRIVKFRDRLGRLVQTMLERSAVSGVSAEPYFGRGLETLPPEIYSEMAGSATATLPQVDDKVFIDATTTVVWNHSDKTWQKLDAGTYRNSVREGIKMSKKQASIDLVTLPIPAPVAAETE